MMIAMDAFEGIVGHAVLVADDPGTNRFSPRVKVSKRARMSYGSNVTVAVTIIDVSEGGVGFIFLSLLLPDEQFILRVTGRDGDRVGVHCLVRWCQRTGSGRFRIGAEFLRLIDYVPQSLEILCA
jgi:hypothetical protein